MKTIRREQSDGPIIGRKRRPGPWLFFFVCGLSQAIASEPSLPIDFTFKKASIPLYDQPGGRLLGVIRIENFAQEYQRKGFFRIGVLPMWVASEVRLEIVSPAHLHPDSFRALGKNLKSLASRRILEFQKLQIVCGKHHATLWADKMQIAKTGRWHLSGNVIFQSEERCIRAAEAFLDFDNDAVTELQFRTPKGMATFNFATFLTSSSHPTNHNP